MRTVLGMLLLAVGGALAVVMTAAAPATACSCVGGGDAKHLEWSDVVFTGEVLERSHGDEQIHYRFAVDRVFKGEAPATTDVSTSDQDSACGLTDLQGGVTYLVFAHGEAGGLGTSSCSGTHTVSAVDLGAVEEVLGAGKAPTGPGSASPPASPVTADSSFETAELQRGLTLGLVSGAAAVVIAVGLLLGRRRTR